MNGTERQGNQPISKAGETGSSRQERRERLLQTKVSRIISAHDEALDILIAGGFEPLANPAMRFAMSHTVNLAQAFRIRGMDDAEEDALIEQLLDLGLPLEVA